MSIATTENPAGQHGAGAHSDGGWDTPGYVPVQTRSARFASTRPADFPEVTGHEVQWKLTPVASIRTLIDGVLDGSRYATTINNDTDALIEWIPASDKRIGSAGTPEDRAAANAWSSTEEALSITFSSEQPVAVSIDRSSFDSAPRAAHTIITAQANSNSHLVLRNSGPAQLSENVEIVLEDGARLTVVTLQEWSNDALYLSNHFVQVGRNAHLTHIVVTLSGKVVCVNPSVHLSGEGAQGELYGLYFADAGQHFEQQVYLHHEAAHTKGRVNYKGALQGQGARTVWIGDVLIGPDAAGTDSYEQNRNLVLSEGTRADSIPNLEIETGDILGAGHASATGRFDDEQLFYLQARGISEPEARRLVVIGFLAEIVQKVGDKPLEEYLHAAIEQELKGTHL
jgi:Fe-S cluster assembly protein SufD